MRILGTDPGYAIVGFGALDYTRNTFTTLQYGACLLYTSWQTVSISRYTAMAARQEAELKLKGLEDTQYQNLLDTHKTLMGWRHDFFNHLSVIGQMIQTGRGDEAPVSYTHLIMTCLISAPSSIRRTTRKRA